MPTEGTQRTPEPQDMTADDDVRRLLHDAFDDILDEEVPEKLKRIVARLATPRNGGDNQG